MLVNASLIYHTEPETKNRKMKELKRTMDMLRRNGAGQETMESVRREEKVVQGGKDLWNRKVLSLE